MNRTTILMALVALLTTFPANAECNTPPTDGDEAITSLEGFTVDVLANANDIEGQMLTVEITSTNCPGSATVQFEMIALDPQPRIFQDCRIFYSVSDGQQSNASIVTITMPTHIFSDGFELGSAAAWDHAGS